MHHQICISSENGRPEKKKNILAHAVKEAHLNIPGMLCDWLL